MVQTDYRSAADWDTGPAMGQTLDQPASWPDEYLQLSKKQLNPRLGFGDMELSIISDFGKLQCDIVEVH
jgi:hypothetical protein